MPFTVGVIIPFLALLSYTAIFLIVALNKPPTPSKNAFRAYLFSMLIWSLAAFLIWINEKNLLFWFRLMTTGALASMLALFQFVQEVLYQRYKITPFVYFYGFLAILIAQFTDLAIPSAYLKNGAVVYEFSPFISLIAGPGYLLMLFNWAKLYLAGRDSKDDRQKNRFRLLLFAISIIILGSTVNFTNLGKYPIDIAANLIAALLITYSILRHNLLDISVVIRKSLLYTLPTILLGAGYFLIINLAINIFHLISKVQLLSLSLIVAILTALIVQPFRDLAQNWIDRLFFRERFSALNMLKRIGQTASSEIDINRLTSMILEEITKAMHIDRAAIFLKQNGSRIFVLVSQIGRLISPRTVIANDHPIVKWLFSNDDILISQDMTILPSFKSMWENEIHVLKHLGADLYIPLKSKGDLVGLITLGPKKSEQLYSTEDKQILLTLANQIAIAVQNAQLYSTAKQELIQRRETEQRLQLQLKRLSALQNINLAITTNIDLQIPLYLLLEQVTDQLEVDAADVLLLDEENQQLFYVAGRGFQTEALKYTKLDVGEGLAGRAAETMDIVHINDLKKEVTSLKQSPLFNNEGFVAYYGAPLISKGKVQGVLELFHRSPLNPDSEWMDFLNTLTSETAIAVDNALLFRDLEKSNLDLAVAYETTLEGWARTLELRDRETEGHSQRVMDLTMRLARKLGILDEDLINVQRGAVLHDIGKMGVPDSILLKEGPLTEEEWEIMRKHPVYAYDMLSTIPFLRKAIDIPYCHHEKWNGSGYPCGLKGEEIPLSARIFAIVDVWDALKSDRPYRKAWTEEEALTYIQEQSGSHFDPVVVNAFFDILNIDKRKRRK